MPQDWPVFPAMYQRLYPVTAMPMMMKMRSMPTLPVARPSCSDAFFHLERTLDECLRAAEARPTLAGLSRAYLKTVITRAQISIRHVMLEEKFLAPNRDDLVQRILSQAEHAAAADEPALKTVVNATGVSCRVSTKGAPLDIAALLLWIVAAGAGFYLLASRPRRPATSPAEEEAVAPATVPAAPPAQTGIPQAAYDALMAGARVPPITHTRITTQPGQHPSAV